MLILMAQRRSRTSAHVTLSHYDYTKRPARSWILFRGELQVPRNPSARKAAEALCSGLLAALEAQEDLPRGETVYVQLALPGLEDLGTEPVPTLSE